MTFKFAFVFSLFDKAVFSLETERSLLKRIDKNDDSYTQEEIDQLKDFIDNAKVGEFISIGRELIFRTEV